MLQSLVSNARIWALSVKFVDNGDGTFTRGAETLNLIQIIRLYQASIR